jgi:hypothetical protein
MREVAEDVQIVIALDDGRVKQCSVRTNPVEADAILGVFRSDYGGARRVAIVSKLLDNDEDLTPSQRERVYKRLERV